MRQMFTKGVFGVGVKMRCKFSWIPFICKIMHEWDP